MTTGFLDICGPISVATATSTARAVLRSRMYSGWPDVGAIWLALEGLNQFAVRLGRGYLGSQALDRVLPVGIRSLSVVGPVDASELAVEGTATRFGPTVRVQATVRCAGGHRDGKAIQADLVVASAGAAGPPKGAAGSPEGILGAEAGPNDGQRVFFPADPTSHDCLGKFSLNPRARLLSEHFPGTPIAPGSLALAYIADAFRERLGPGFSWSRLHGLQFLRPIVPGPVYSARALPPGDARAMGGYGFEVVSPEGELFIRGAFLTHHATSNELRGRNLTVAIHSLPEVP